MKLRVLGNNTGTADQPKDERLYSEAVVWGSGDTHLLRQAFKEVNQGQPEAGILKPGFSSRWIDVKTLITMERLATGKTISTKTGLRSGLAEMKLQFDGHHHDSGFDAYNTLRLFVEYVKRQKGLNQLVASAKQL
jgi:inhibitor of KinA sporulation pathway (predicted exonuclease)